LQQRKIADKTSPSSILDLLPQMIFRRELWLS
jgi:hypothetical protein